MSGTRGDDGRRHGRRGARARFAPTVFTVAARLLLLLLLLPTVSFPARFDVSAQPCTLRPAVRALVGKQWRETRR